MVFDGCLCEYFLLPLIWRQVCTGFSDSLESSLGEVAQRGCATFGRGVNVVVTSIRQDLLWHRSGNNTGTSRSRDESHMYGTTLGVDLARNGVRLSELGTPVTTSDRDNGELGQDDSGADGVGNLLGALDAETNVALVVTNDDGGLESGSLSGTGLFLYGLDLENFVLEFGEKVFDDFGFLDRQGEGVNLSQ